MMIEGCKCSCFSKDCLNRNSIKKRNLLLIGTTECPMKSVVRASPCRRVATPP